MTSYVDSYRVQEVTYASANTQQSSITSNGLQKAMNQFAATENSYQREIESLKQQLRDLQGKNDVLEAEKDELVSQVSDLRLLLKRVSKESENNLKKLEEKQRLLERRAEGLESALQSSYENASHFEQLRLFWQDME